MRTVVSIAPWALSSGLMLCSSIAFAEEPVQPYPACEKTPTEGDTAAAKGAFQAGNGSFNEADYTRAITYWEDAYRRDCTAHPLLLNLARAYELNGQKRHAVSALETFLARNPNSAEEAQIKRRIEKLQEQLQAEAGTPAPAAPAPAAAPAEPVAQPAAPVEAPPADTSGGHRSVIPLVVAGGGGVLAIVGSIVYFKAQSDVADFEDQCPSRKNCSASVADGGNAARTRSTIGGAIALVGLAAAVGGTVWYFVQPTTSTALAPHGFTAGVTPVVAPGYGGLDLVGSF